MLLSKAEGISTLTYVAPSLNVDSRLSKGIDIMSFLFYVEKQNSVIMNTNQCWGLNFLDFTTLNYTFKID